MVKPQWKAAIDFKWIRDNKEAVADNIENRKSSANLELVLELYDKLLNVQKVNFLSQFLHSFGYKVSSFQFPCLLSLLILS